MQSQYDNKAHHPVLFGRDDSPDLPFEPHQRSMEPLIFVHSAESTMQHYCEVYVKAELFKSQDDADRGGVVIKVTAKDLNGSGNGMMLPFIKETPDGFEIHSAGDGESSQFLKAMKMLFAGI